MRRISFGICVVLVLTAGALTPRVSDAALCVDTGGFITGCSDSAFFQQFDVGFVAAAYQYALSIVAQVSPAPTPAENLARDALWKRLDDIVASGDYGVGFPELQRISAGSTSTAAMSISRVDGDFTMQTSGGLYTLIYDGATLLYSASASTGGKVAVNFADGSHLLTVSNCSLNYATYQTQCYSHPLALSIGTQHQRLMMLADAESVEDTDSSGDCAVDTYPAYDGSDKVCLTLEEAEEVDGDEPAFVLAGGEEDPSSQDLPVLQNVTDEENALRQTHPDEYEIMIIAGARASAESLLCQFGLPFPDNVLANAIRHATWTVLMCRDVGADRARVWSDAHEENQCDTVTVASDEPRFMDCVNNELGVEVCEDFPGAAFDTHVQQVRARIMTGGEGYVMEGGLTCPSGLPSPPLL